MKNIKLIIAAACVVLFAACQDKGEWDAPGINSVSQYGNNSIQETNVIPIKKLLDDYNEIVRWDDIKEITDNIQIKGRVTGTDIEGNFYKKITIQDEPANAAEARAITVSIDESGIWGYLQLGQEILIDLKGLSIGASGKAAQIGVPYTNKGNIQVGRMPSTIWQKHFKILGNKKEVTPIDFTSDFLDKTKELVNGVPMHAGMLVILRNVTFKEADGKQTFGKDTDPGKNNESNLTGYFIRSLNEYYDDKSDIKHQPVQIFTSGDYAKFSSMILPFDTQTGKAIPCDILAIAGYYDGIWQLSIIDAKGITVPSAGDKPGPEPQPTGDIFSYTFDSSQGDFVIDNKSIGEGITYVWNYDSKNKYMKASSYKGGAIASESWLISPKFSLDKVTAATLTFNNACNQVKEGTITDHIHVMVSTDGTNWTEATIANLPSGSTWDFVDSTVDLKNFVGKTNVQVAFKYVSTTSIAPTWEIKSLSVK